KDTKNRKSPISACQSGAKGSIETENAAAPLLNATPQAKAPGRRSLRRARRKKTMLNVPIMTGSRKAKLSSIRLWRYRGWNRGAVHMPGRLKACFLRNRIRVEGVFTEQHAERRRHEVAERRRRSVGRAIG